MYFSSFPDRSIEKVMIKRRPTICTPMRIPKQLPLFWIVFSQISLVFARDSSSRLYYPKKEAISIHERTDTSKIVYRMSRTLAWAPSVHLVAIAHRNLQLKCHRPFTHSIVTQLAINSRPFIIPFLPYLRPNIIHVSPNSHPQLKSAPIQLPHSSNFLRILSNYFYTIAFNRG